MRAAVRFAGLLALVTIGPAGSASAQTESNEPPLNDSAAATTFLRSDARIPTAGAPATLGYVSAGSGGNGQRPRLTPCNGPGCGGDLNGSLIIGPGAQNYFNWEINDAGPSPTFPNAPGVGNPTPNANHQFSGWSQEQVVFVLGNDGHYSSGSLTWTATSTAGNQFQLALFTLLNPTTVGQENFGPMSDFDPHQTYVWPFITFQGTYNGPIDSATLTADTLFDTSQFLNTVPPTATFTLELVQNPGGGGAMDIVYSPVPEPGTLSLVAVGIVAIWRKCRLRLCGTSPKQL